MQQHHDKNNFELIHRSKIPRDATILPSVWQIRRKRHLSTGKIKKYKARINVDGSRMVKLKHYDQTYAPVASWAIIRLIMIIAAVNGWPTKQLDYVLAFPQAPIERDLYISIPKGYQIENEKNKDYALKLNKNLYGQKQAGKIWNDFLVQKDDRIVPLNFVLPSIKISPFSDTFIFKSCIPSFWCPLIKNSFSFIGANFTF